MNPLEIVKVQRPLSTNADDEPCLIYDSRRKRDVTVPFAKLPPEVRAALDAYPKVYCVATWRPLARSWEFAPYALTKEQPW